MHTRTATLDKATEAREARAKLNSPAKRPLQLGFVRTAILERTADKPQVGHAAAVQCLLMHRGKLGLFPFFENPWNQSFFETILLSLVPSLEGAVHVKQNQN